MISKICLFFLTFTIANFSHPSTSTSEEQSHEEQPLFCNQQILRNFGLIGTDTPVDVKLSMCPNVIKSCCLFADQITIYEQWERGMEHKKMMDRFHYHQKVYGDLIDAAVKIQDLASIIQLRMKKEPISNCKILAKRIIHFEFKDISLRLKTVLNKMHEFFEKSYSGFYCMICDAENHKYFQIEDNKLIYSEKFCRDIISNSLNVLLYFHVHMMKFLNLLLRFGNVCDANGFYKERPISNDDLFFITGTDKKMLEGCRDFRNAPNWLEMCEPICDKFYINSYNFFFEPHLRKYKAFTKILKDAEAIFEKSIQSPDPQEHSLNVTHRILEELKTAGAKSKLEITEIDIIASENQFPTQRIILSNENSGPDFESFENVFKKEGLSPYEVGVITQINKIEYEKIVAEVKRLREMEEKSVGLMRVGFGIVLSIWCLF